MEECDAGCGGGKKDRRVVCARNSDGVIVLDNQCDLGRKPLRRCASGGKRMAAKVQFPTAVLEESLRESLRFKF